MRIVVDGQPIAYEEGDSILLAMLRNDQHPTGGGCLCVGGDCPHCIATVDGVSYVRTCQTRARPGTVVTRDHMEGYPPLPTNEMPTPEIPLRNVHCDVVVIGGGESGQAEAAAATAAGKEVIVLDAHAGEEVVGVYFGPLVVARTDSGMLHVHVREEVVVATGAAEIHPVAPGTELAGLLTVRAAEQMHAAGLNLGRIVAVGTPPAGFPTTPATGTLLRIEGENTVSAVVMVDDAGHETRHECDTVTFGLGFHPRNALLRMGNGLPVRAVGDAAKESDIPPCPAAGIVCACSAVSVADLDDIWQRGFQELELVKRGTLAGTGTCQGSVCMPHLRSFLADRGKELQPAFTARPVTRQLTIDEIAAGAHHHTTSKTSLDAEHRKLGAQMERSAGWWRPWSYGNPLEEYWAVREAVSIMDVSTLGKMIITGPDVLALLERLYPTKVATIKEGRSRYVLMLDERGYVFDDGMICKESDERYILTFTSGGSGHAEMWIRDWAAGWNMDVRILNQTNALGAINVTGPMADELLRRAGVTDPPRFLGHKEVTVAGVDCRIFRLSFTGELSYELHHPVEDSVQLWNSLMDLGADLGIKPHGLDALLRLRLEKGHIIVGQDTDFDSTPRRIHHEWAVKLDKPFFIGKGAVERTNKIPLDRILVGIEMEGPAPHEGAIIRSDEQYAGYVTSSAYSPVLGKSVMLAWLYYSDGQLPTELEIDGRPAQQASLPFYDKESSRARA